MVSILYAGTRQYIQASCPEERPRHFLPALARPAYDVLAVPIAIRSMLSIPRTHPDIDILTTHVATHFFLHRGSEENGTRLHSIQRDLSHLIS